MVERSPREREVACEFKPRAELKSGIDIPEKWLSSGRMLCERLPFPNEELDALGPLTQDPR